VIHHAWEDFLNWGEWKYAPMLTNGILPSTPLSATGNVGFNSVWWAGNRQVFFQHMGHHNNWIPEIAGLHIDVPIWPGARLYAFSRSGEHNGVFWSIDGELHHVFHNISSWVDFHHESYPQRELTPHTPLAACGRPGWHGVFWAGHSRIHLKSWSNATRWEPVTKAVPLAVKIEPGQRLAAMCRDGEFSGVIWDVNGTTHHVFEDIADGGKWNYETVVAKGDSQVVTWNSWAKPAIEEQTAELSAPAAAASRPEWFMPAAGAAAVLTVLLGGLFAKSRKGLSSPLQK